MKNFFIFFFLIIFLENFSQKVTFEYKVEHKFDIIDNKFYGDSICVFQIAKNIELEENKVIKDTVKNNFYFDLNILDLNLKKKINGFLHHYGYNIKGFYKNKILNIKYIYSKDIFNINVLKYIDRKIEYNFFEDQIFFENSIIIRTGNYSFNGKNYKSKIGSRQFNYLNHKNKVKEEGIYVYYYIKNNDNLKYIIKVNKELNKYINPNLFHPEIEYGIETYENIFSKYTLIDYKIKD